MIADAIALIDFVQKHRQEIATKSALFTWEGTRISGHDFIEIQKITTANPRIWFYKVQERTEYEFIYMPVIPSLFIDNGQLEGENNPDAKIFRFVGNPLARLTSGGEPNVKVNFTVVAYKPGDLLTIRETVG